MTEDDAEGPFGAILPSPTGNVLSQIPLLARRLRMEKVLTAKPSKTHLIPVFSSKIIARSRLACKIIDSYITADTPRGSHPPLSLLLARCTTPTTSLPCRSLPMPSMTPAATTPPSSTTAVDLDLIRAGAGWWTNYCRGSEPTGIAVDYTLSV
jgi:hypothetical protein